MPKVIEVSKVNLSGEDGGKGGQAGSGWRGEEAGGLLHGFPWGLFVTPAEKPASSDRSDFWRIVMNY